MATAAHRVHGMGTALEAPVWPAIAPAEAAAILARFPMAGALTGLRWHSPRPFSAAAIVETQTGDYLLKRHHRRVRTPEALREEHRFLAHLRAAGIAVPDIVIAENGEGAVSEGEWSYELQRKAPGLDLYRERQSWTPFLSHAHARAAGAALARLHLASQRFDAPPRPPRPLVASCTILPARDPLDAAGAYIAARPALADFLAARPWRRELAALFDALAGGLPERLASQRSLWTHNDWHPSNLLWSQAGTVETIFDFGLATRSFALHDLAIALERTVFDWLRLGEGADAMAVDGGAARALLDGYAEIAPLTPSDRETLARLLPLVHIEFALSEIDYFHGVLADRANAMLAWEAYLLGHAEWFLSSRAAAFLERIR